MNSLRISLTPYNLSKSILLSLLYHAPTSYQILNDHQHQYIGLTLLLYCYYAKLLSCPAHQSQILREQGQLSVIGEA